MGNIKEKRLSVKSITNDEITLDLGGGSDASFLLTRLVDEMEATTLDHLIKNLAISLKIQAVDVMGDKVALKSSIEASSFKVIE